MNNHPRNSGSVVTKTSLHLISSKAIIYIKLTLYQSLKYVGCFLDAMWANCSRACVKYILNPIRANGCQWGRDKIHLTKPPVPVWHEKMIQAKAIAQAFLCIAIYKAFAQLVELLFSICWSGRNPHRIVKITLREINHIKASATWKRISSIFHLALYPPTISTKFSLKCVLLPDSS